MLFYLLHSHHAEQPSRYTLLIARQISITQAEILKYFSQRGLYQTIRERMKANIHLLGELLVAELEDGQRLEHADAIELAEMLWAHGVTSAEVTAVDWHIDPVRAPLGGQKIAIHSLLRSREASATQRPLPKHSNDLTKDQLAKLITTVQENDLLLSKLNAERVQKKS